MESDRDSLSVDPENLFTKDSTANSGGVHKLICHSKKEKRGDKPVLTP
ncbi:MAG: hypothetical protein ACRENW_04480 [Thermodesulfobacteriota bacterium]